MAGVRGSRVTAAGSGGHGARRGRASAGVLALAVAAPICSGCVAHGEAVAFYRVRGTLLDAASGQPLAGARVWVAPTAGWPRERERMAAGDAAEDGSFRVDAGQGVGSVTWILFVPVREGDGRLPPTGLVYVEAEHEGRSGSVELPPGRWVQKGEAGGDRAIDLGAVALRLERGTDLSGERPRGRQGTQRMPVRGVPHPPGGAQEEADGRPARGYAARTRGMRPGRLPAKS